MTTSATKPTLGAWTQATVEALVAQHDRPAEEQARTVRAALEQLARIPDASLDEKCRAFIAVGQRAETRAITHTNLRAGLAQGLQCAIERNCSPWLMPMRDFAAGVAECRIADAEQTAADARRALTELPARARAIRRLGESPNAQLIARFLLQRAVNSPAKSRHAVVLVQMESRALVMTQRGGIRVFTQPREDPRLKTSALERVASSPRRDAKFLRVDARDVMQIDEATVGVALGRVVAQIAAGVTPEVVEGDTPLGWSLGWLG